jgi:4-amino-4-deoxy-L-arabinose transferase-like glycosyltransferase
MARGRSLFAIALLASLLHAVLIARTLLPAQDGLKYIRFARLFQAEPWPDVVRDADVHPLYPALVALAEPVAVWLGGSGPDAWRISAQVVASVFSVGLLVPVYFLTRSLFDARVAFLAAGILALLPRVAEIGRDTLADSLGLFASFMCLWLGARALRAGDWRIALGSGWAAGLGYLARPEAILVPGALALTWLTTLRGQRTRLALGRLRVPGAFLGPALLAVAGYALIKGEISEKIALRTGASLGPQRILKRSVPQHLPVGLDDARWDFSPKEETDRIPIGDWRIAVAQIGGKWWEELCWFFAVMTVWGLARRRFIGRLLGACDADDGFRAEGRVLLVFTAVYGLALVRHSATLGYLSGRHVMALVVASAPWAAAGAYVCGRGIATKLRWTDRTIRWAGIAAMGVTVAASFVVQMRPNHLNHLSRWGHWAAGQWLAANARPDELILDTRGWARFISGRPGYDYWHVRQALTDSHLSYVLVGLDELDAPSPRAATLKALLAYAATPLLDFPADPGQLIPAVRLYRFRRPSTWEGMAP